MDRFLLAVCCALGFAEASSASVVLTPGTTFSFAFSQLAETGYDSANIGKHNAQLVVRFTGDLQSSNETISVVGYEDYLGDSLQFGGSYGGSPRTDIPGMSISTGTDLDQPESLMRWRDLEGVVRVEMLAGSVRLDYVRVTVKHDGVVYSLQTTANATSPAGDFNLDGAVDGADLLRWQRGQSPSPNSAVDLAAWRSQFGLAAAVQIAAPEPGTGGLAGVGAATLVARRARKRKRCREPFRDFRASRFVTRFRGPVPLTPL